MKIAIVGGGAWGRALYKAFSITNQTTITSRRELDGFNQVELKEAFNAEVVIVAISAQVLREWLENCKNRDVFFVIASKGIDSTTLEFLDVIARRVIDEERLAFLSGPSFAKEVERGLPTALTIFSKNRQKSEDFAKSFPPFIKPYFSDDITGGEIAGAYKNIIAIASGICEGLRLGLNARAALTSRGLVEIARFGEFFGGRAETFLGLSGSGDLFLTANSDLSRNFRVGLMLAKSTSLDDILKSLGEVAEGVYTTKAVVELAKKHSLYTPIANEVFEIIEGKNPQKSLKDLLNR
ncbi:MAG: NAD(P)H-dependent glycerol-3-phosphate dehydrogenase [Campylobacterales bacterium]